MGKILIIFFILHIISFLLLIISLILILIQNIKNIIFYLEKSKDIIAEKLIYEQFSHEVYSNINSKILYNISKKSKEEKCDEGSSIIKFPIKIESFYDCENINDNNNIDKNECLNQITSSSFCCESNCCRDYVFSKEYYHFCSNKNNFYQNDSRNDVCSNFSIYNGKFYYIKTEKYCAKRLNKTYEELLLHINVTDDCSNITFDTVGHHFCIGVNNFSDFSNKTIVQNIFSVVEPKYINIENYLRINILLNKNKYDETKIIEELKKLKEISIKKIEDAFLKEERVVNNYNKYEIFYLKDLISGDEEVFDKFKNNRYYNSGNITWYTKSYIGFNDYNELQKFKKYFDEKDNKNNSLYKISTSSLILIISIISIIIVFFLFIFIIIYISYFIKKIEKYYLINIPYKKISLCFIISSSFIFLFFFIIYLSCFICKYDYIQIDMEIFFKLVLEKYNERRKQIYLLAGFIIAFINLILAIILFYFSNKAFKSDEVINHVPNNISVVKFCLKDMNCEHKIKLDTNKLLSQYINIFEKILESCNNCRDNYIGIQTISDNNRQLDLNEEIEHLHLNEQSLLIISDD